MSTTRASGVRSWRSACALRFSSRSGSHRTNERAATPATPRTASAETHPYRTTPPTTGWLLWTFRRPQDGKASKAPTTHRDGPHPAPPRRGGRGIGPPSALAPGLDEPEAELGEQILERPLLVAREVALRLLLEEGEGVDHVLGGDQVLLRLTRLRMLDLTEREARLEVEPGEEGEERGRRQRALLGLELLLDPLLDLLELLLLLLGPLLPLGVDLLLDL